MTDTKQPSVDRDETPSVEALIAEAREMSVEHSTLIYNGKGVKATPALRACTLLTQLADALVEMQVSRDFWVRQAEAARERGELKQVAAQSDAELCRRERDAARAEVVNMVLKLENERGKSSRLERELAQANKEQERLREALRWYADSPLHDAGWRAREALKSDA